MLDLTKSEEDILAGASQGFRRKLRKAKKNDIEIMADTDDESIEEFCRLEKLHAVRRNRFLKNSLRHFAKAARC